MWEFEFFKFDVAFYIVPTAEIPLDFCIILLKCLKKASEMRGTGKIQRRIESSDSLAEGKIRRILESMFNA